nr:hypothetical protein Iba_chr15eCG6920 [Ipomoea batatas]
MSRERKELGLLSAGRGRMEQGEKVSCEDNMMSERERVEEEGLLCARVCIVYTNAVMYMIASVGAFRRASGKMNVSVGGEAAHGKVVGVR